MMSPLEKENLRLESASLREDVRHLESRLAFFDHWSDPIRVVAELKHLRDRIDAMEHYASTIVAASESQGEVEQIQEAVIVKQKRLSQIASILSLERHTSLATTDKQRQHAKAPRNRVGCLSREKSLELATNLGMTVEELGEILMKGKVSK